MTLAVITGDIVASREIGTFNRQKLYEDLKTFLNSLKDEQWISGFEMFRGDSFQCVLEQKQNALRASLLIRAYIKSYFLDTNIKENEKVIGKEKIASKGFFPGKQDIRLAIGIGQTDFYSQDNLAQSDGEAFELSGEELDKIKKAPYRLVLKTNDSDFNNSIEPTILLLDAVLQKWTNNQAETVLYKLKRYKEEEIGGFLKISQSAVNQRIRTSQWFAIDKLLTYFENKLKDWK